MRTGYVAESELMNYSHLSRVKKLDTPSDVATVLEAYIETRSIDTDTFKKIKDVYTDNEGHYFMVLADYSTDFDIIDFLNTAYKGTLKITYVNIGLMFPQRLSNGLGDIDRVYRNKALKKTARVSGFYDHYHDKQIDIPSTFVRGKQYFVGRSQSNDYTLAPCPRADKVSRQHCGFYYNGSDLYIEDSQSNNGTYVNGRRIPKGIPQKLSPGDMVKIVDCELEIN